MWPPGTAGLIRHHAGLLAGLGVALAGAGYFLDAWPGAHSQEPHFETAVVTRGTIEDSVTALGKLQPRDYVDVGAQASGQLLRLYAHEGDVVAAGQLLAEIDPTLQEAQVEAGEAEIARLKAQLIDLEARARFAADRAHRQARLVRNQFTSAEENDRAAMESATATAQLEMTRAQIRQVAANLRSNQAQLRYTKVFAPMAGTVVSVEARQGQTLVATYQTPQLLRIADLSVMTVWTQVAEADVPQLKAGMPVWFTTLGHPDRRWESRVRQILPAPSQVGTGGTGISGSPGNGVVLYTALFDVPDPDGELRPQMSAQTFFITARAENALIVPAAALKPVEGESSRFTVRVLESDGAVPRTVRIGVRTRFKAEVLEGLIEGERVITGERVEKERSAVRFTQ
ncbi:efflux RND transporter periplasmic adaptor subunit [Blastochloris viridis]|uniref:Macrolide-specific efflux protein MacA n=1 Tax=Blastochloris viridis TaxID=1079 RepID=A0A0H5BA65_BLAVI|nr:efflux RND transporter periplasmic adaptor subunit [Blastochloris viridis]ALK10876.1 Macrolide export protein MacA [Blastochloris viridis]BAR99147.1 macrolide-specific efflux protein MacA [Blastochloris viridis]CUU43538.1 Macrolide-specific efflux protein macA precursor [Blastochloris viridis]